MNDDGIGIETVDAGRKHEVVANSLDPAIPAAAKRIQQQPSQELQEMRPGNRRHLVPVNRARAFLSRTRPSQGEVFYTLGIKMNLAMLPTREPFEQFR